MALAQKYNIVYPFSSKNTDNLFLDINQTYEDGIKSQILHIIFTPKGQKLRDPEFGTDLIKYIFNPSDDNTYSVLKNEIIAQISKYISNVEFGDINVYSDESGDDNSKIVSISYKIHKGNTIIEETVGIKI